MPNLRTPLARVKPRLDAKRRRPANTPQWTSPEPVTALDGGDDPVGNEPSWPIADGRLTDAQTAPGADENYRPKHALRASLSPAPVERVSARVAARGAPVRLVSPRVLGRWVASEVTGAVRRGARVASRQLPDARTAGRRPAAPQKTDARPAAPQKTDARAARRNPGTYGRIAVITGFWILLGISAELWAFNTSRAALASPADLVTAAGRVTGMLGGAVLIVAVLMTSRVVWLEGWVGARDLMRWHRGLGVAVVALIVAHLVLIVFGYALTNNTGIPAQAWSMLTTFEDMVSAFAAAGILVVVALLAVRQARRRLRYELWHLLHLAMYVVLLLAYGHQFALGSDLQSPLARDFWAALYGLTVACLLWGRLVRPTLLNLRHRLHVAEVVAESPDTFSIYIDGRYLPRLQAEPGQFFRWRFLTRGGWWQSHPFSLSRAPNRHWLRLTVHAVGDHTQQLRRLRPGTRVLAEGPFGTFTAGRRTRDRALLIAGGSGIAPIRALLDRLPDGSVLIYRASSPEHLVFRDELDRLADRRGVHVHYVLGPRTDPWAREVFTPAGLTRLVPDLVRRDVYLCGPPGLIDTTVGALRELEVPGSQIHMDPFEF